MNKLIITNTFGVLGVILGFALLFGTWRSLVGWVLGSGIFGASILVVITGVLGTALAILIIYNSFNYLTKVNKKEISNEAH